MVYEFAELADPVTETGFDGRLGAAGELGDPGESQGVGGFQADHFGLFFREGCEQPGDSFVFFAEFLIAGVVRKCGGPFGRQRRIAPVAVVVAAAVGDRPPEVALHVVDAVEVAIRVEEPQQDVLHDVFRIGLRSRAEIGEAVKGNPVADRRSARGVSVSFLAYSVCFNDASIHKTYPLRKRFNRSVKNGVCRYIFVCRRRMEGFAADFAEREFP